MTDEDWLAKQFEESRAHLRAVALRMLGSSSEADDAVQEAWLRLSGTDASVVTNLGGWLTTVVARICLDMLRSRKSRREDRLVSNDSFVAEASPESEMLIVDAMGPALLAVLDLLAPGERVAFVLHDLFGVPFEEIAPILGRSLAATRQLASRGRRRVRGAAAEAEADRTRQREVVHAFLAASRGGDLQALLGLLDPEVTLHADEIAVRVAAANAAQGAPTLSREARGARAVAETFKGRARGAQTALIDGDVGAVWAQGEHVRAAFLFTVEEGQIVDIELVMDPRRLATLAIERALS